VQAFCGNSLSAHYGYSCFFSFLFFAQEKQLRNVCYCSLFLVLFVCVMHLELELG